MTTVAERADAAARETKHQTLPQKIREWATKSPNAVAMREKDFGIWQEITWSELWEKVLAAAHGLLALGVEPGDRVSIHSEDR
nr:AMP-binding protein [Actinomycetota bacterium]